MRVTLLLYSMMIRPLFGYRMCDTCTRKLLIKSTTATPVVASSAQKKSLASSTDAATLHSFEIKPSVLSRRTPVIILHGLLGNSNNFRSWAASLATKLHGPRHIFSVDMRNHGLSSHHESMTYVDMSRDIVSFMDEQHLGQVVLIGHSMGGKAACMTSLMNPDRIKGLVIIDIAPVSYSVVDQTNWGETHKIIKSIRGVDFDRVTSRREVSDIVDPMIRAFVLTNLETSGENGKLSWRVNVESIHRNLSHLAKFEVEDGVEPASAGLSFTGDTLFIAGGKSRYVRSAHLPKIESMFPNFSLRTLANAGHWVHADDPEGSVEAVKAYLDRPEFL